MNITSPTDVGVISSAGGNVSTLDSSCSRSFRAGIRLEWERVTELEVLQEDLLQRLEFADCYSKHDFDSFRLVGLSLQEGESFSRCRIGSDLVGLIDKRDQRSNAQPRYICPK